MLLERSTFFFVYAIMAWKLWSTGLLCCFVAIPIGFCYVLHRKALKMLYGRHNPHLPGTWLCEGIVYAAVQRRLSIWPMAQLLVRFAQLFSPFSFSFIFPHIKQWEGASTDGRQNHEVFLFLCNCQWKKENFFHSWHSNVVY